jgi:hypothetical protein
MSETGKNLYKASQVVENTLAAFTKDFESGVGAFFSGGNAKTHEAEPVKESQSEQKQGQEQDVTTAGKIVASQNVDGKDLYLVQTENPGGKPESVLFEKGGTNYQHGADVTVSWGGEGQPKSAQVEKGVELTMGGIAGQSQFGGQSQFSGQSQFASAYHDDGQGL